MCKRTPKPVDEGKRIRLVEMPDDPCPVPQGTEGEVTRVHDMRDGTWQVSVKWDNGRTLSMICPPDKFELLG